MSIEAFRRARALLPLLMSVGLGVSPARAEVELGRLLAPRLIVGGSNQRVAPSSLKGFSRRADGKLRLLVAGPESASFDRTFVPLRSGLYAWTATPERVVDFVEANPDHRVFWSAPKRVMLDRATVRVRADVVHGSYGLSGHGVVVGIVDTGVDVRHPDLCNPDGTSRIAWLLDLSKSPTGKHTDIEEQFGCNDKDAPCAVYSGADLDELIANDVSGDEPRDSYGHGTHVASLAAGNGASSASNRFAGVAPEATLVVVRATRDSEGLMVDPDILLATQFIFTMAERMGMPAVVNLSLGGDFGAHDGTSMLERELGNLVDDAKGRSIVVAAGNSGSLYSNSGTDYPAPLGIHSTVQVLAGVTTRLPILIGRSAVPDATSQIYLWVATRSTDDISVGLDTRDAAWIAPVSVGDSAESERDGISAVIQNGVTESDRPETVDHSGAYVVIEGSFANDTVLSLSLRGRGTASVWVQPAGGIDPMANGFGVLLPGAQREGTITVPATAKSLIAVGATLDRPGWTDVDGVSQAVVSGVARYLVEGEVVPFSAAGPSATDDIKPDLVAPGAYVIGAMSKLADPRTLAGESGMFAGDDSCSKSSQSCLVVDDYHAVAMGTSMASPVVAGAVALLLEQDPTLTQAGILRALQSGTRNVFDLYATSSQVGAGALDIEGALLALSDRALGTMVSSTRSFLTLGGAFVRPDPKWPVYGMVHLRDDEDRAVDVDSDRLEVRVHNGTVKHPSTRQGPGFYRFELAGATGTGGQELTVDVLVDGKVVCRTSRSIAVDAPNVTKRAVAGSGCAVRAPSEQRGGVAIALLGFGAAAVLLRRKVRDLVGRERRQRK
ncbi:MAG: S8 family serine peptidase [Polyangiaceae bacterium]